MEKQPNILLIVTDEQCVSECGAYGDTPCMTPNLDRLAAESHFFENAYTPCPLCSPARASLITGLYPHSHGMTCNAGDLGCNISELSDSSHLLPRILSRHGYSCGYNGKWHLGTGEGNTFNSGRKAALPSHYGYEGLDFPGHGGIGMGYPQYKEYLKRKSLAVNVDIKDDMAPLLYGSWKEGEEVGVPHFITDYTISLMEEFRQREKPFFMHHNFWGPHQPYYVPEEYLRMYDDVEIPQWESFAQPLTEQGSQTRLRALPGTNRTNWQAWERLIRHKYAFMTYIDHQIGRMLKYLKESSQERNTLVIFCSDHGDNLGRHGGLIDKGFVHFEDTHRIPLMVRDVTGKNERRHELVSSIDIYPTILEAAGITVPQHIHGRPLLTKNTKPRDYVVTEFHGLHHVLISMRTVRSKNLKYGWTCCSDELFDLNLDPFEKNNLAGKPEHQKQLSDMKLKLLDWMRKYRDPACRQYERALHEL